VPGPLLPKVNGNMQTERTPVPFERTQYTGYWGCVCPTQLLQ